MQKICDEVPKIDWARAFPIWRGTHSAKEYDFSPAPGHPEARYQVDVEAMARQRTSAAKAAANRPSRGGRGRGGGRGGRPERNRNHKDRHLRDIKTEPKVEGLTDGGDKNEVLEGDGSENLEHAVEDEKASDAGDSGVCEVN